MVKNEDSGEFKLLLRKFCYAKCDLIHTVSEGLKKYFVQSGFPEQKIIAINNGVDTQQFTPGDKLEARKKASLPEDAIVLGIVGRFDSGKRHSVLIEVFNQLGQKYPNLFLLMVGDGGDDYGKVKELVGSSPYKNRIVMTGFQKDMRFYYRAMDLLVITSLREGFPNVLLESMACGVPALAHPTPGTIETIESGCDGVVTNLETRENIKVAIENAITNLDVLKKMGGNARLKIENRFALNTMAKNYASIYKMLIKEN
jgi:glycosyltransferase involved in cell wall biosynthesis